VDLVPPNRSRERSGPVVALEFIELRQSERVQLNNLGLRTERRWNYASCFLPIIDLDNQQCSMIAIHASPVGARQEMRTRSDERICGPRTLSHLRLMRNLDKESWHLEISGGGSSFTRRLGGWTAKRQPDLTQVMFIVSGDLIEFVPQRAHAVHTMHELQMATPLMVHSGIIDDCVANRFVYLPGELQGHP